MKAVSSMKWKYWGRQFLPGVLILVVFARIPCLAQTYTGPKSLGPFRIDKDVSMSSLFSKLGLPAKLSSDTFCYRAAIGQGYLILTRMVEAYDSKIAGAMELSDFRNCYDKPVQTTNENLPSWRTERGVGLGSSEQDVRKAYGKPTSVEKIGSGYRWAIRGASEQARSVNIGTTVLRYVGLPDSLNAAFFGIRDGKVAWISLSKNE